MSSTLHLTKDNIEALTWASAATAKDPLVSQAYDEKYVHMLTEMSFSRHRMLDYDIDENCAPKTFDNIDYKKNILFFPESKEETAWGVRSVTHRKLFIDVDTECAKHIQITDAGEIVVTFPQKGDA